LTSGFENISFKSSALSCGSPPETSYLSMAKQFLEQIVFNQSFSNFKMALLSKSLCSSVVGLAGDINQIVSPICSFLAIISFS
jgi:hypothetical protein